MNHYIILEKVKPVLDFTLVTILYLERGVVQVLDI